MYLSLYVSLSLSLCISVLHKHWKKFSGYCFYVKARGEVGRAAAALVVHRCMVRRQTSRILLWLSLALVPHTQTFSTLLSPSISLSLKPCALETFCKNGARLLEALFRGINVPPTTTTSTSTVFKRFKCKLRQNWRGSQSVWPVKSCQMSIKLPNNDSIRKMKDFDTFTK